MSDNLILGAMVSPDGKAPFVRAPLVTWAPEGATIRDRRDTHLTYSEWEALLAQREATRVEGAPPFEPGLWLWVFRSGFVLSLEEVRSALREEQRLVADEDEDPGRGLRCYVRDAGSADLRAAWASKATQLAEAAIEARDPNRAVAASQTAYHLEPRRTPRVTALIAQALRLAGNTVRAEGYERIAPREVGETS